MAAVRSPRAVSARQAATERYWQARARALRHAAGGAADAVPGEGAAATPLVISAATFRARKELALIALHARRLGWTRLAEASHLALLRGRGCVGAARHGGAAGPGGVAGQEGTA